MKKQLAVLLIALMLTGIALSVSADPIDVGGNSAPSLPGPVVHELGSLEFNALCTPIDVGGN
ncbi:unnamed protein product [marine sediment metagenome]|uniref:Uncharacterized protein n=1 Tax=marine sediment metagenome TaxID=412755 RepID=X0SRP0_9ZZZZ